MQTRPEAPYNPLVSVTIFTTLEHTKSFPQAFAFSALSCDICHAHLFPLLCYFSRKI
jgi:hypothetical protein